MYGTTQSSLVSIDWSAQRRSMLRRTTATSTAMRPTSSRSGPLVADVAVAGPVDLGDQVPDAVGVVADVAVLDLRHLPSPR